MKKNLTPDNTKIRTAVVDMVRKIRDIQFIVDDPERKKLAESMLGLLYEMNELTPGTEPKTERKKPHRLRQMLNKLKAYLGGIINSRTYQTT